MSFDSLADTPFDAAEGVEIGDGSHKRRIVVLLADVSNSMNSEVGGGRTRIEALNAQLERWVPKVQEDGRTGNLRDVEFGVITFGKGGVRVISADAGREPHEDGGAFTAAALFTMGPFTAGGTTPIVEAIERGIQLAQARVAYVQRVHKLQTGQPRLIMFSDGAPTDDNGRPTQAWRPVADQIRSLHAARRLQFFGFGVPGVDEQVMRALAPDDGYFTLESVDFKKLLDLILIATSARDPYATLRRSFGW